MRKDKEKITRLRSSGKSYSEISRLYSIPKSTLSAWFKDHKWSKDIAQQLIKKSQKRSSIVLRELSIIRGEHLKKLYNQAEIEAKEEFVILAMSIAEEYGTDFSDSLIYAILYANNIKKILTYDQDFGKFPGIEIIR